MRATEGDTENVDAEEDGRCVRGVSVLGELELDTSAAGSSLRSRHTNWTSPVSALWVSNGENTVQSRVHLLALSSIASKPSKRSFGTYEADGC